MPSTLRKAIGAMKDQTSISLAKVSGTNFSNLDVGILKATTHEEVPTEGRYVNEVLLLTSSSSQYASACVHALARRITRTRNWIVALKSLTIIYKVLQQGDPHFAQEVFLAMKRGAKVLNLSNFRDDSNSSPWDYTAFVRTFALYLEERLSCCLMGKLHSGNRHECRRSLEHIRDMKPDVILDKIVYWQRLLDRVLATRPTGTAKNNKLVQISLYLVVRESFDLYRDISDGLALVLENFFQLQHCSCMEAFHMCSKASKQFDELVAFYSLCKGLGIGRPSEYPTVQKISEKLLETLEKFLKDNADSIHIRKPYGGRKLLLLTGPPLNNTNSSERSKPNSPNRPLDEKRERAPKPPHSPKEDLIKMKETNTSKSPKGAQDNNKKALEEKRERAPKLPHSPKEDLIEKKETNTSKSPKGAQDNNKKALEEKREQAPKQLHSPKEDLKEKKETDTSKSPKGAQDNNKDLLDMKETVSKIISSSSDENILTLDLLLFDNRQEQQQRRMRQGNSSLDTVLCENRKKHQITQENNSRLDLMLFNDNPKQQPMPLPHPATDVNNAYSGLNLHPSQPRQQQKQLQQTTPPMTSCAKAGCWETELAETATNMSQVNNSREGWDLLHLDNFYNHSQNYNNPFLQGESTGSNALSYPTSASLLPPTFSANNPHQLPPEADLFSPLYCITPPAGRAHTLDTSTKPPLPPNQQHQWLQQHE